MTLFVNAMIYRSSLYLLMNLIIRSRATSKPALMTSRSLTSLMSQSTLFLLVNLTIRSCTNSEPALMILFVNAIIDLTSLSLSHSKPATININILFKLIKRLLERLTSKPLIAAVMNYATSHKNMTFKEKKIMLRSVLT